MRKTPAFTSRRAACLANAVAILWSGLVAVPPARAAGAVLVGAGDIARCDSAGDSATAELVGSIAGTVFTLGDNAYDNGTWKEFRSCFGPTWGRFRSRTRPSIGNHEYRSDSGKAYWDYFGGRAGRRGKGWYSYDAGPWHVVVLNGNCSKVGCRRGSEQERWLRADLAAHDNTCTLAYWHQPRFSSDREHGADPEVAPFWDALYDFGADLVLGGHAHNYERFAPQTPQARADAKYGIRQIIVGTGGAGHYRFRGTAPNSEVRNAGTFGVLKLELRADSYDWRFIPAPGGRFRDSGHGSCHGRP